MSHLYQLPPPHLLRVFQVVFISVLFRPISPATLINAAPYQHLYTDGQGNCALPANLRAEIATYQPQVDAIIAAITAGPYTNSTWSSLSEFIETFGPRLTGSAQLERSIDYMVEMLRKAGLHNVHTEAAPVPRWERGFEAAELVHPYSQKLNILGLGGSVGTPRGGLIADVVAVGSFEEFDSLSEAEVSGKIVLFAPQWEGYGRTVQYRSRAASVAATKGAVAALVRSVTPFSIGSPHTGMQHYADGVRHIPVASVTVEDAAKMLTMHRRGIPVAVRLEMSAHTYPDPVISRNTIGELPGSQFAANESVILLSGHLDSWDVGNGAMDDAGGAFIAWKAVEFLTRMGLRPRRTIRAVLWTGEEQGYLGARQYKLDHKPNEAAEFNLVMESDEGTFEPTGLGVTGNPDAVCLVREILQLMHALNATQMQTPADGLSDCELWTEDGFPGVSLLNRNERYFWFHHSAGDSMLQEQPDNLDKGAALFAAVAFVVADLSVNVPRTLVEGH